MTWTHEQAVAFCTVLERIAPSYGAHVALTGGTLYKTGARKDCDVLFYRIRQTPRIDTVGLLQAMKGLGIAYERDTGWCIKATYDGKPVDFFFPERPRDEIDPETVEEYGQHIQHQLRQLVP